MTGSVFEDYMCNWERKLDKKKKIELILDNCPAHPKLKLKYTELVLPPQNITSLIQLNQGITKNFIYLLHTRYEAKNHTVCKWLYPVLRT
jgi:hypothetical protein